MPALDTPRRELEIALTEPVGAPWADAPVLLLGTPGSGVERIAALLADQPGLTVLRDRIGTLQRATISTSRGFSTTAAISPTPIATRCARAISHRCARPALRWIARWSIGCRVGTRISSRSCGAHFRARDSSSSSAIRAMRC